MADTPNGETVTPGDSQTTVTTTAPVTTGNAVDPAEVERLRKEAEQKELRIRQLENEAEARKKADEEAKTKQLAENEEWKQLAEQEKAKREALETEREAEQRTAELKVATDDVFKDYSDSAIEIAREAGLSLTDATDEAKAALKAKLDTIQSKVAATSTTTPNNPSTVPASEQKAELIERMKYGDKDARAKVISNIPGVQEMRKQAGLS